jgi:hypothetical protein
MRVTEAARHGLGELDQSGRRQCGPGGLVPVVVLVVVPAPATVADSVAAAVSPRTSVSTAATGLKRTPNRPERFVARIGADLVRIWKMIAVSAGRQRVGCCSWRPQVPGADAAFG